MASSDAAFHFHFNLSALFTVMHVRWPLLMQIPATLAIMAWLPGNLLKLGALLMVWAITFQKFSKTEWLIFSGVSVFFTIMNALALTQGIFAFTNPDFLGMPFYELLMWGFYVLHLLRMLGGRAPQGGHAAVWTLAILYAGAFAALQNPNDLLLVSAALLVLALTWFHEPMDLAYTSYMLALGAAVEYTGVLSGQWHYPGNPVGGVPLWFVTMWGGVGFFTRRLLLPLLGTTAMYQNRL